MKRTIFIGLLLLAVAVALLPPDTTKVIAQSDGTPTARFGIHWDKSQALQSAAPELIALYIDVQVRCSSNVPNAVIVSQTLFLSGPAMELNEGLFREYDWDWGTWTPPADMVCVEWQRLRWEVPEAAGAVLDGEYFIGQIYGEYWPKEGQETQEDDDHFWLLGPLANGEWYDSCPGPQDCATPGPTLTPRPTLTPQSTGTPQPTNTPRPTEVPEPEPTCRFTPTCPPSWPTEPPYPTATLYPSATPYPTDVPYPTYTPWPTQPPFS